MRKLIIIALITVAIPLSMSKPAINHATFYQEELNDGEEITFGVQFEPSEDISYATAKLYKNNEDLRLKYGAEVGFTSLLDRNGDNFYSGSLGPIEGGNTYKVKIKGCNSERECVSKNYERKAYCSVGFLGSCIK